MQAIASFFSDLSLWPHAKMSIDDEIMIRHAQRDARDESDKLAAGLELLAESRADPFGEFAQRARAAQWRSRRASTSTR